MAANPEAELTPAHADTARALCDAPEGACGVDAQARLGVGWALKAACYAAWSSDPPRALRAAEALRVLSHADGDRGALQALADWTEGIASLIRSRMAEALEALDRAADGWRAIGEPLHAAHAQVPKIMALAVLGRFDDAQACALATEAALRREGDEHAAAKVRLNLGSLAFSRDEHAQAVLHYRAAAVRFARVGDHEHSVMADIGLADALSYLGRFDEAVHGYARARLRAEAHGLPVLAASADHGKALLALAQGRYHEALAGLEAARRSFGALELEHRRTETEKNLADAYLEVRLLPEAIALYTTLAAALQAEGALATLPWTQAQLARAFALSGQAEAALALLAEAALGFEAQDNAAGRATVQAVRAALHAAAGRPSDALACAAQARTAFDAAGWPAHRADTQVQIAAAHLQGGDASKALAVCEALFAEASLAPQVKGRAQRVAAEALLALGRDNDARVLLEAAIDGIEELRAVLPGEDLRRAFLADASRPYALRLKIALDDAAAGADGARVVLHWLERFKARALQERLGSSADRPRRDPHTEALRERLDWIHRLQQRQVEDDGDASQTLSDEAARLEGVLLEAARRARLLEAAPGASPDRESALDIAALQRTLGPGRALVEYGVVDDELFAVVVRHDGLRLRRRLASWAAVRQSVQALRFQIDAMRAGSAIPPMHLPLLAERARRRLAELHALVWQALAPDVADDARLVIVPHGVLHGVPFAALGQDGTALVDHHELVMAASAATALRALAHEGDARLPQAALLVGDGTRLAHVPAELRAVGAALGRCVVFDGPQASVAALRAAASKADLLHIACHARFRADSPLFSALHLVDGLLTAGEVQDLRLRARLVVLSACESALGEAGVADEGVGLVRSFLMAGAARVLGSHWAVDDASTAEFMAHFYRGWRGGQSIAAAVGLAQRALRAARPHPAHWAAFALHGAG